MENYGHYGNYPRHNQEVGERSAYGNSSRSNNDQGRIGGYSAPMPPPAPSYPEPYPYFLPADGIARQVVQTDLPRYLGNNAQCKPGIDRSGREGFLYRGYRMLTDAQILSLKEDSAKWNNERQQYASRNNGRDGPDYDVSHTFGHSYRNNPDGYNPDGNSFSTPIPPPPPPPPEAVVEQPNNQDPRFLFMPHPDNRPWYDNWTGKYVPPFQEPGATSHEPPPTATAPPTRAQIPRHMDLPETVPMPPQEEGGLANPLDPTTGLPMVGHWVRQRDGGWSFFAIRPTNTRPARTTGHYGQNEPEERGEQE